MKELQLQEHEVLKVVRSLDGGITYVSAVTAGAWQVIYHPRKIIGPPFEVSGLFAFPTAAAARFAFPRTVPCSLSIWRARTTHMLELPRWVPNYSLADDFGFTEQTLHDFWRDRPDRLLPCPTEPDGAYLPLHPEMDVLCADLELIEEVTLAVLYHKEIG